MRVGSQALIAEEERGEGGDVSHPCPHILDSESRRTWITHQNAPSIACAHLSPLSIPHTSSSPTVTPSAASVESLLTAVALPYHEIPDIAWTPPTTGVTAHDLRLVHITTLLSADLSRRGGGSDSTRTLME